MADLVNSPPSSPRPELPPRPVNIVRRADEEHHLAPTNSARLEHQLGLLPPLNTDLMGDLSEGITVLGGRVYESPATTTVLGDSGGESMRMGIPLMISPENFRWENPESFQSLNPVEEFVLLDTVSNSNSDSDSDSDLGLDLDLAESSHSAPSPSWLIESLDFSDEDRAEFDTIQEGPNIAPVSITQEFRNAVRRYRWRSETWSSSGSLTLVGLDFSDLLPSPIDLPSPAIDDDEGEPPRVPHNTPQLGYEVLETMACADVTITVTAPTTPSSEGVAVRGPATTLDENGCLSPLAIHRPAESNGK